MGLNENSAMLLHSVLLTFECLLVAMFNFYSWEVDVGKIPKEELLYDARGYGERKEEKTVPLLDA